MSTSIQGMQKSAMRMSAVCIWAIHGPNMPISCWHVIGLKIGNAMLIMTLMSDGGARCALASPQMVRLGSGIV